MRWKVMVWWGEESEGCGADPRFFRNSKDMKAFLDNEVFCLSHDCPLPQKVIVERVGS